LHEIQIRWNEGLRDIIYYTYFKYTIHLVDHTHHYENEITVIRKYMAKD